MNMFEWSYIGPEGFRCSPGYIVQCQECAKRGIMSYNLRGWPCWCLRRRVNDREEVAKAKMDPREG